MRPSVFGLLALLGASTAAMSATDDARVQTSQRLDVEIYRATQALIADPQRSRPAGEALLARFEAFEKASEDLPGETTEARSKRTALRGPLHNLRLALEQPAIASRALTAATKASGPLLAMGGIDGSTCERPIELVAGQPLRIEIDSGSSRWLTVSSSNREVASLAITTVGSEFDAAVSVYLDCREIGKTAVAGGDDNFGLQAIVALPKVPHPLLVQVRNQGQRGIAVVNAINAVTISGRVTRSDNGAPITDKRLEAYQGATPAAAGYAGGAYTQENGIYQLTTFSFDSGQNTYIRTISHSEPSTIDEAWDNVACTSYYYLSGCGPGLPTAVASADGVAVSNINFALSPGASIFGQVVDRLGAPVRNATINATRVGDAAAETRSTQTDEAGRYRIGALRSGQYRLIAYQYGYTSQVFRNLDCEVACEQIVGTPVTTTELGQSQADFSLSRANSIRVSLTAAGQPLGQYGYVYAINTAGIEVASASFGFSSNIATLGPLPAGTYRVRAHGNGLVSEYYQDIVCAQTCGQAEFQAATPISVSNDAPVVGIAMDLAYLPELTGVVTSEGGAPIVDAQVKLIWEYRQTSVRTDAFGRYRLRPDERGSYLVHAGSGSHVDEAHPNIPCELNTNPSSCPFATLVNFSVGVTPPPVDFQLGVSSRIRGRALNAVSFPYFQVSALTVSNQYTGVGSFTSQSDNSYQLADLPPGTFRFGFSSSYGRLQIYRDIVCSAQSYDFSQCPTQGASSFVFTNDTTYEQIDFRDRSRYGRLGRVTDQVTGLPVAGIIIDAFDPQSLQRVRTAITDADGRFDVDVGFSPQSYYLATDNYRGYRNEVYNNRECAVGSVYLGTCSLVGATAVGFPGDDSELFIALGRGSMVFKSGFD